VKSVKKTNLKPRFVFIKPPSVQELERRLRARKTETDETVNKRLETAKQELEYAEREGSHDKVIVNDDLNKAYAELEGYILNN
jgi:guanylate kinase